MANYKQAPTAYSQTCWGTVHNRSITLSVSIALSCTAMGASGGIGVPLALSPTFTMTPSGQSVAAFTLGVTPNFAMALPNRGRPSNNLNITVKQASLI